MKYQFNFFALVLLLFLSCNQRKESFCYRKIIYIDTINHFIESYNLGTFINLADTVYGNYSLGEDGSTRLFLDTAIEDVPDDFYIKFDSALRDYFDSHPQVLIDSTTGERLYKPGN